MQSRGYVTDSMYWEAPKILDEATQHSIFSRYDIIALSNVLVDNKFMGILHEHDKRVVVDMDDDYRDVARKIQEPKMLKQIWQQVRFADAITVSTPRLAEMVKQHAKRDQVFVVPNLLDVPMWDNWERSPALTIGLSGGKGHEKDWRVVPDAVDQALKDRPDLHFMLFGFYPDYMKPLAEKWNGRVHMTHLGIPYAYYPGAVAKIDIGLCPVDPEDEFNLYKTPIKALELMASGAVAVCSDAAIYRDVVEDGFNGILTEHSSDGFYNGIHRALEHREFLATQGRRYVEEHHSLSSRWQEWRDAYLSIYRL